MMTILGETQVVGEHRLSEQLCGHFFYLMEASL